jgi:hypothetical protein
MRTRPVAAGLMAAGLAAAALGLVTSGPADAAGVQHLTFSFDETAAEHVEGIGAGCPDFIGTLVEQRHDELAGVMLSDGTVHGRTVATARVQLVPDDPEAVSYDGGYVLHETGTYAHAGQDDWIETSTVHGTLTGSDGSSFRIAEVMHLTTRPDGTAQVWFDRMSCP